MKATYKAGGIGVLFVVVAVVGFTMFRKAFSKGGLISSLMEGKTPSEAQDENKANDYIKTVDTNTNNLSMSQTKLQEVADQLHKAMRDWGTDENKIFDLLQTKKVDDLKYIFKAFGYRKETLFGVTTFGGHLIDWLEAEFSGSSLEKIGKIFQPTGLWLSPVSSSASR